MKLDVVIAGVGGQGNVLMSRILARAGMKTGLQVRTSEVIGMAQRGGPVTSQVRLGQTVYGGIIPNGQADVLLGLELAETVRALPKLRDTGVVIAADTCIVPVAVALGKSVYEPVMLREYLGQKIAKVKIIAAGRLAREAGNEKAANMVLLGALATLPGLPFSPETLWAACAESVPEKFREVNQRAFALGGLG